MDLPTPAARVTGTVAPLALAAAALTLGWWAGVLLSEREAITGTELGWVQAVNGVHSPLTDLLARVLDVALSPLGSVIIWALVAASVLARTRHIGRTLAFLLISGIPWLASAVLKEIVQRPRPDLSQLEHVLFAQPESWSYPSGHTAFAASLATTIVLVTGRHRRIAVIVPGAVLFVVLVAWSRVALGMHYPSDVAASMIIMPTVAIGVAGMCGALASNRVRMRRQVDAGDSQR